MVRKLVSRAFNNTFAFLIGNNFCADIVVGSSAGNNINIHTYEPLSTSDTAFRPVLTQDLQANITSLALARDLAFLIVSLADDEVIVYLRLFFLVYT